MRLHSVVLFCTDVPASEAWYRKAGFAYLRGFHGMAWFAAGDTEIMLHPSEAGPAGHAPELHVAVQDVDAAFAAAVSAGLTPMDHQNPGPMTAPVTRPWGTREFELEDPDGHRWGFVQLP